MNVYRTKATTNEKSCHNKVYCEDLTALSLQPMKFYGESTKSLVQVIVLETKATTNQKYDVVIGEKVLNFQTTQSSVDQNRPGGVAV